MTSTKERHASTDLNDKPATGAFGWLTSFGSRAILWFLVILWLIPTLGLFISSFRPEAAIKTSGWWTFFTEFDFTLENYTFVLSGEGAGAPDMVTALLNSLAIVIPATIDSTSRRASKSGASEAHDFSFIRLPSSNKQTPPQSIAETTGEA